MSGPASRSLDPDTLRRALLEGVEDATFITDASLTVVDWNAAMARLTGVGAEQALGRKADGLLPFLREPGVAAHLTRALAGEATSPGELPYRLGEPEREGWIEARYLPWRDAAGAIAGVIGFHAEVSERRRRALFMRAIDAIGHSLASSLDLNEVLDTIADKALEVMGAESAMVISWDGRSPLLKVMRATGRLSREYVAAGAISVAGGPISHAILESRPFTTSNILEDPALALSADRRAQIEREGFKAVAAAPLVSKGRVHGALVVHYWSERAFSDEDRAAMRLLGEHAALAIHNPRVYHDTERRRDVAEVLAGLARQLTGMLDAQAVADLVARGLAHLLNVPHTAVFRYEAADGTLHVLTTFGSESEAVRDMVLQSGEGAGGRAVEERKVIVTPDILVEPSIHMSPALRERVERHGLRAVIGIPLVTHDRVVGALVLGDRLGREFSGDELQLLQAFADQAALAFENARLYAAARESLTRLRETQVQLVQAAKMSALGQLVSGVAHELNNPLSVIIGYGQLLLARELAPVIRRPIELMVSQGDRMAKIVRNLLYFARQRPPERASVALQQVMEQALTFRLNQLNLSGISVEKEFAEGLPPVAADSQQLEQVFLNLLLNAEQAILEAKPGGRIVLRTRAVDGGGAVEAQVIDDGPGILPEAQSRVFEPFFTTKTVGMGTGLGLSVSYGIVEEHGGRLSVQSRPGETVFTIELPIVKPPASRDAESARRRVYNGIGRVALVVEDEPSVLDLVVTLLSESGWRVDVASGGRAGLDSVQRRRYDLIVSDMRMPEGDGEEFYRNVLAGDEMLARRFIFITGDTANPDARAFLDGTDVPVIEKPFPPAVFEDAVHRVMTSLSSAIPPS